MRRILFLLWCMLALLRLNAQYVTMGIDGKFKLNGNDFYPMIMNYYVDVVSDGTNVWASPSHSYGNSAIYFECTNGPDCIEEIRSHFQAIKDMGFNTVRLVGGYQLCDVPSATNLGHKLFRSFVTPPGEALINLNQNYNYILSSIDNLLDVAEERGLKVIIVPGNGDVDDATHLAEYKNYLNILALRYKNHPALMAYSLRNEPERESRLTGDKNAICSEVTSWINLVKDADPNHLVTVGYNTPYEVMRWDPELIPTDYASFHPYPNGLDGNNSADVLNTLYWYKNNITKPWVIEETGAIGTWASLLTQADYADISLKACVNCGGAGYAWWMYQDVDFGGGNADKTGLLRNSGSTPVVINSNTVYVGGSQKNAVQKFLEFGTYTPTFVCNEAANYYNKVNPYQRRYTGFVKETTTGLPIKDAFVLVHDGMNVIGTTYSQSDGSFEITSVSTAPVAWVECSAVKKTAAKVYPAADIANSIISAVTVPNGQTYTSNNNINLTLNNFVVNGNGMAGGSAKLYAQTKFTFGQGTKVEKGGTLNCFFTKDIGTIYLSPLESCAAVMSKKGTAVTTGVNQNHQKEISIQLYPNPASGIILINAHSLGITHLIVLSSSGSKVYEKQYADYQTTKMADLSNLESGVYFIQATLADHSTAIEKLVINR